MAEALVDSAGIRLSSPSGLRLELNPDGAPRRFDCNTLSVLLFAGNGVEGGLANLYLRRRSQGTQWTPLLGPLSPTRFEPPTSEDRLTGLGEWQGINYVIELRLARMAPAWFWHVRLENISSATQQVDLTYAQDLALAPYGAVRLNEYYVSQYIDHTALTDPQRGIMIASRQNQPADGRYPWSLIGSLRKGTSFATDARQLYDLAARRGEPPPGLSASAEVAGRRLQHEHSMVVLRDTPIELKAGDYVDAGFFGSYVADHPDATSPTDLDRVRELLALPEAAPGEPAPAGKTARRAPAAGTHDLPSTATLFSSAPLLDTLDLDTDALRQLFGSEWRHEEFGDGGERLSFFHGTDRHVVLREKELRVLRPHGQLLLTGTHTTPDETALTSTAWMSGTFHSMVTQGHVSINRFLSTVHGYLGLFRSHGQRVFVDIGASAGQPISRAQSATSGTVASPANWALLNVPSAFEMSPTSCRWIYRHRGGEIQVHAEATSDPHELTLSIEVTSGPPARFLISHHVALNGDDGSAPGPARWRRDGQDIVLTPAVGSELAQRFRDGSFHITPQPGTEFQQVGGDELLFLDGRSRGQPYLCVLTHPARRVGLGIRGQLVPDTVPKALRLATGERLIPKLTLIAAAAKWPTQAVSERPASGSKGRLAAGGHAGSVGHPPDLVARLADIVPWFTHDALVHYLSPRGLEQYSGGGWGTRDVCQGPVEMLLALDRTEPLRDLLLRVMAAQNPDGDWPQWFMFFERERGIRAGDSHGDIVFWPLIVLAQYLLASGDVSILDEPVPFFDPRGPQAGERASVWEHAQRALSVTEKRVIPGTHLAAYGHGDWNDSLQPADPVMRERLCSSWTVTLHFQTLTTLARALRAIDRESDAVRLEHRAEAVRSDFQRLLIVDGVLSGYALFETNGRVRYLLHPGDTTTGVRYSALAMIHAMLEDLFTPAQTREHLRLIDEHLTGPDGVRLFDRPMPYHGGPQRFFQRAESATFFGREIGLMYMHAHLRYAQAMAHIGETQRFVKALCQANPIGIRTLVPSATPRQSNCYYSSSDAAFEDRYQASAEYDRVVRGTIGLDGGWRVYSSGAGIALALILRRFLGWGYESDTLCIDPVMPTELNGLQAQTTLLGRPVEVRYRVGTAGCGVNAIRLNGAPLPFVCRPHPHRRGPARLSKRTLRERLGPERNRLEIDVG